MLRPFVIVFLVLALAGAAVGVYTAATAGEKPPKPPPARTPSVNPFGRGIASSGLIEASTRNVEISAPESGLVEEVFVRVGDRVKRGAALFRLESRALEAELIRAEAARTLAKARLAQLEAMPRPEEIPPLEAAVQAAQARADDAHRMFGLASDASRDGGSTPSELDQKRYAALTADAELAKATATLALMKAGAWSAEIDVAKSSVAQMDADIASWRLRLERLTVRSPIDGVVLKREVEPGEYETTQRPSGTAPPLVLGDLTILRVRAQVNEEDAPQLRLGARGMARVRGAYPIETPLKMLWIEPLAIAKRQLTGAASELVDTRVVDVLFEVLPDERLSASGVSLYPGQIVDVFIEAAQPGEAGRAPTG